MAAVGVVAGMPNMAYAGARGAAVATSPLSVAVPAGRHELVLLDMATAVMALGRIAQLKAAGTELPPGVAVTADGEPTTDPAQATVPLPPLVGRPAGVRRAARGQGVARTERSRRGPGGSAAHPADRLAQEPTGCLCTEAW